MSSLLRPTLRLAVARTALTLLFLASASSSLAVEKLWKTDGTTGDWITGPWALSSGGTFNQPWNAGDSAPFTANSLFTLDTFGPVVFNTITVDPGVTVTAPDAADTSPFSTGGGTGILDVG